MPLFAAHSRKRKRLSCGSRRSSSTVNTIVDEPVDHQTVLGRINVGATAVVALEAQPIGCDDPVELM